MKWPSYNNSNPLTWKCKLFGCRNRLMPFTYYRTEERHGITGGFSFGTAATATWAETYQGCYWCHNYKKIIDDITLGFPAWLCDCETCVKANQHRKFLYE